MTGCASPTWSKELEQDYDVIMPDGRGHGKSSTGNKDYSSQQRVEDLAGLIRALKLDTPVVGGHSMGADTSMNLAANYPELTRGIFLEDPPIILPGETFGDGKQTIKGEDIGKMMAKFMRMFKLMPRSSSRCPWHAKPPPPTRRTRSSPGWTPRNG